jgi:hypothetical protein
MCICIPTHGFALWLWFTFNGKNFIQVVNEDVASPTELAKAYMGSRPSKVSPSMLESRCQPFRDNSTALINHTFTPKSPMMSLTPRSSGCPGVPENYFVTPRSRGRSAIYNMARTPYSRVHASTGLQVGMIWKSVSVRNCDLNFYYQHFPPSFSRVPEHQVMLSLDLHFHLRMHWRAADFLDLNKGYQCWNQSKTFS